LPDDTPFELEVLLEDAHAARWLSGANEENLGCLEQAFGVSVCLRGERLCLKGPLNAVERAEALIRDLLPRVRSDAVLRADELRGMVAGLAGDPEAPVAGWLDDVVTRTHRGKPVRARTANQRAYVEAIASHTLTFGIGPAGTGKTYLAAALAAQFLREKRVSRIILTRPAVEAGESLGFLPGDFQAKVDPYFRPLYDAMYELLDGERVTRYLERGMIEVAPLAYMRGRTLSEAFIILDEAQNTTAEQMKMFLTRIGFGSRVVVTGDRTQVDLPRGKRSALHDVEDTLRGVPDVAFVRFDDQDVVRHDLVRRIVQAYAAWEARGPV
jgi:phosphate starvation-inducible PhoH-like protein